TLALGARVLLLDEPTAGIAQAEVASYRPIFREVRDLLGATIIVIEHDMPLIMELADRIYVLSAGRVISEGPPSVVRNDPAGVAAYIGTDEQFIEWQSTPAISEGRGPTPRERARGAVKRA